MLMLKIGQMRVDTDGDKSRILLQCCCCASGSAESSMKRVCMSSGFKYIDASIHALSIQSTDVQLEYVEHVECSMNRHELVFGKAQMAEYMCSRGH